MDYNKESDVKKKNLNQPADKDKIMTLKELGMELPMFVTFDEYCEYKTLPDTSNFNSFKKQVELWIRQAGDIADQICGGTVLGKWLATDNPKSKYQKFTNEQLGYLKKAIIEITEYLVNSGGIFVNQDFDSNGGNMNVKMNFNSLNAMLVETRPDIIDKLKLAGCFQVNHSTSLFKAPNDKDNDSEEKEQDLITYLDTYYLRTNGSNYMQNNLPLNSNSLVGVKQLNGIDITEFTNITNDLNKTNSQVNTNTSNIADLQKYVDNIAQNNGYNDIPVKKDIAQNKQDIAQNTRNIDDVRKSVVANSQTINYTVDEIKQLLNVDQDTLTKIKDLANKISQLQIKIAFYKGEVKMFKDKATFDTFNQKYKLTLGKDYNVLASGNYLRFGENNSLGGSNTLTSDNIPRLSGTSQSGKAYLVQTIGWAYQGLITPYNGNLQFRAVNHVSDDSEYSDKGFTTGWYDNGSGHDYGAFGDAGHTHNITIGNATPKDFIPTYQEIYAIEFLQDIKEIM